MHKLRILVGLPAPAIAHRIEYSRWRRQRRASRSVECTPTHTHTQGDDATNCGGESAARESLASESRPVLALITEPRASHQRVCAATKLCESNSLHAGVCMLLYIMLPARKFHASHRVAADSIMKWKVVGVGPLPSCETYMCMCVMACLSAPALRRPGASRCRCWWFYC